MTVKKGVSDPGWLDPDDAPEWTDDMFDRAEVKIGDQVIRRGRPKGSGTKASVTLRIDRDIIDHFRAEGPGWQTRINEVLRRAL